MAKMWTFGRSSALGLGAVAGAAALLFASLGVQAQTVKESYAENEVMEFVPATLPDTGGYAPVMGAGSTSALGFEGPSQ